MEVSPVAISELFCWHLKCELELPVDDGEVGNDSETTSELQEASACGTRNEVCHSELLVLSERILGGRFISRLKSVAKLVAWFFQSELELVLSNLDESISIASIVEDSSSVFHIVNAKESVISSSKLEWLVPNSLADSFCSTV